MNEYFQGNLSLVASAATPRGERQAVQVFLCPQAVHAVIGVGDLVAERIGVTGEPALGVSLRSRRIEIEAVVSGRHARERVCSGVGGFERGPARVGARLHPRRAVVLEQPGGAQRVGEAGGMGAAAGAVAGAGVLPAAC